MGHHLIQSYLRARSAGRVRLRSRAEEVIETGAWSGEDVWILGGGPSLPQHAIRSLRGKVIAINMAFTYYHNIWLLGSRTIIDFLHSRGIGVTFGHALASACWSLPVDRQPIAWEMSDDDWGSTVEGGLAQGECAGCVALNMADVLGARRIFLLGFDMHGGGSSRTTNWHGSYPERMHTDAERYSGYVEDIRRRAPRIKAEVLNLTPGSALDCFPSADLEDFL